MFKQYAVWLYAVEKYLKVVKSFKIINVLLFDFTILLYLLQIKVNYIYRCMF